MGTSNMAKLVAVPEGEDETEWIAVNCIDIFNEIELLFEFCQEAENIPKYKPGKGFPPGVVYKWKQGSGKPKPVSGPDYCSFALSWVDTVLGDGDVFPESETTTFPPNFLENYVKEIFVKMFRVYAIMFYVYKGALKEMEVDSNLNTSFKHFVYFAIRFNLLPSETELSPLVKQVNEYREAFKKEVAADLAEKRLQI
eukprot:CAMPEP_0204828758 /NCGR_PEP_ID=MMETSP1346-20131115/6680_1 /ASSEMBLY_ACC=CAM_ASM_000771 /TAXON_ID=215587 /ORGANISM="Aplanochytrium stocchinoi, Strain GSBS06" /LENGTH=196 /DNA_ID=CAMNT_0051958075 /DNA_START=204 /DNA_END=794 /DNA_ORIENTATION=+